MLYCVLIQPKLQLKENNKNVVFFCVLFFSEIIRIFMVKILIKF